MPSASRWKGIMAPGSQDRLSAEDFEKLKRKDPKIYRKVFDQYVGLLQFIAGRFQLSAAEADDIVQESFLKLHRDSHTINSPEAVKSWLVAVARHAILDLKRREKVRTDFAASAPASKQENTLTPDALAKQIGREMDMLVVGELVSEIAANPGDECFALFYRDGLSAREIAEQNQEPISTITTRLSRLRKKYEERIRERITTLRDSRGLGHD